MPDSTASAPVFIGSTMSLPASSASAVTNGPSWSLWKARLVSVIRSSWARAASSSTGLAVAEVHRRVRGQAVQVALAVDVGDPGAVAGRDDHTASGW